MACRLRVFLLKGVVFLLLTAATVSAWGESDPIIQPQLERREIEIPKIDTEDFELGAFIGIMSVEDFGTQAVYGARLAYHVTPNLFMEGSYGRTGVGETSYEKLSGGAKLLTDSERKLGYYDISLGYNLLPGETYLGEGLGFTSDFYAVAGVGSSDFAGNQHFTVNLGTGYRLLANDLLAVHLDMRDHLFNMDLLGENKMTHNIEISGGLSVFF